MTSINRLPPSRYPAENDTSRPDYSGEQSPPPERQMNFSYPGRYKPESLTADPASHHRHTAGGARNATQNVPGGSDTITPAKNQTLPPKATTDAAKAAATAKAEAAAKAEATAKAAAVQKQNEINLIATQLRQYFPGSNDLKEIVDTRAAELHDMGETPDSIAANMTKARQMDHISELAGGAVKAFPFAISGFASGAMKLGLGVEGASVGMEALAGAIDGGTAMVLKSVGDKVFADTVKGTKWLEADASKLEPAMQEVLKHRDGLGERLRLAPLGGQGFNGRNVVTSTVAALTKNNPNAVSNTNNGLSLAAGAAGGVLTNMASATHGPEFLLGRTDWKEQYTALKDTSIGRQMASGGWDRTKTLAASLVKPQNYVKGVANIVSPNMLAEIGTLAGGVAGANVVGNVVRNAVGSAPLSSASTATIDAITNRLSAAQLSSPGAIAKDRFLNVAMSSVAYAAQGVAGALVGPSSSAKDDWVDAKTDQLANTPAGKAVSKAKTSSVEWMASLIRGKVENQTNDIEMQRPRNANPTTTGT